MAAETRDQILSEIRERIFRYLSSKGGLDREQAEDVAQETVMLLMTKYKAVEGRGDLVPLSVTISRYLSMSGRRGFRGVDLPDFLEPIDLAPQPDDALGRKQMQRRVREAVHQLGAKCRELIELVLEEYTADEIREKMRSGSSNNYYVQKHRCLNQLLVILGGRA